MTDYLSKAVEASVTTGPIAGSSKVYREVEAPGTAGRLKSRSGA